MSVRRRDVSQDRDRIRRILVDVYVRDMYVKASREALSREFDDAFRMLVPEIDGRSNEPVGVRWGNLNEIRSNHPKAMASNARFEFPLIDVVGNAAVARVDVFRDDVAVYTDYVSLYRVDGEWKLVSKVFHSHLSALDAFPNDR